MLICSHLHGNTVDGTAGLLSGPKLPILDSKTQFQARKLARHVSDQTLAHEVSGARSGLVARAGRLSVNIGRRSQAKLHNAIPGVLPSVSSFKPLISIGAEIMDRGQNDGISSFAKLYL